jgi:hypothetical protein
MRGIFLFAKLVSARGALLLITLLATSCATSGFKQTAAVGLELRFYRWDSVCIAKPDTRENGFATLLDTTEVLQQIERLKPARDLAAVVVGYGYDDQQVRDIGAQWYQHLANSGFQRVVVLRGSDQLPTAGLPIIYDSAIAATVDPRGPNPPQAAPTATTRSVGLPSSVAAVR